MTVDLRGFLRSSITSPDVSPGITSWDVLPSITSRRSRPRLLPKAALRLISERFFIPAKRALRPGMIFASLASRHDLRQPCVRRCSSAPCVPSKAAIRPQKGLSLANYMNRECVDLFDRLFSKFAEESEGNLIIAHFLWSPAEDAVIVLVEESACF